MLARYNLGMTHPFRFRKTLAIQAANQLFMLDRSASRHRVLNLLYLCEREYISEAGTPFTGSRYENRGGLPVLIDAENVIGDCYQPEIGIGELCRYSVGKLWGKAGLYLGFSDKMLDSEMRALPEASHDPLTLSDIATATGCQGLLEEIVRDAHEQNAIDNLFERVR